MDIINASDEHRVDVSVMNFPACYVIFDTELAEMARMLATAKVTPGQLREWLISTGQVDQSCS